jgi:hypothetical protein
MNEINVPELKNPFKFPNNVCSDEMTELSLSNVRPFAIKLFMFLSPNNSLITSRIGYFDEQYDLYMLIGSGINESEKIAPISELKCLHIFELPKVNVNYFEIQKIFPGKL